MKPLLAVLALAATASAADMFPFQLPWDDASESATNVSWLNDKPAGRDGFVNVKDGHLFAGEKRLRIFGVNVCFGANFPDKEMAPKVAARMAKFGINCVRFHHMDMFSAPSGIFAKDGRTLDPGQLDRLDWFIAKLKEHGIYADLNLHVSRTYPDRLKDEKKGNPQFDKGVDNYCAAMIALQKDYARDLLTHVNKYTGNRYADEPAVALVEINNENALGFQWWAGELDDLGEPYRGELERLWAAWVLKKHGGEDAARKAWSDGAREPGAELLGKADWHFEQHGAAVQSHSQQDGTISVTVEKPSDQSWHVQFSTPVAVEAESYEVRFCVQAPKDTSLTGALQQAHEPWKVLGQATVPGGTVWRAVSATVKVGEADAKARLTIGGMGLTTGTFEFTRFSLRRAGLSGDFSIAEGRVPFIKKRELSRHTPAKQRDWQAFIWDTETAYWNGMRDFLKKELGVKAPIVGTQGAWSPGHVQAGMDVIDSHAYWHHPDFQGRGWNAEVWSVKNEPMAGTKDGGTLPGLAAQRVAGKPFICTEYSHPAPNTYSAETFPLLCAFAALQDWDGVFAFSYSHRGPDAWAQDHFDNFFDIDRHPVKMATLPGAVVGWRRGEPAAHTGRTYSLSQQNSMERTLRTGPSIAPSLKDHDPLEWMNGQLGHEIVDAKWKERTEEDVSKFVVVPHPTSGWSRSHYEKDHGLFWMTKPCQVSVVSWSSSMRIGSDAIEGTKLDEVVLTPGPTRQNWACYQFTVLDHGDEPFYYFATAKRILITATGDIENTGMGWKNAEKSSVGRDWGKAPVLVEGPAAKITLPGGGKFRAWALDERGHRRTEIPVKDGTLEIGPQWKTLWYEVERE